MLGHYALPRIALRLTALGNRGGFSGARLWRVDGDGLALCLRAWPPGDPPPERLRQIHHLLGAARAAGLTFIPAVLPPRSGPSWVAHAGRLWELTTWLPGRADFHTSPSAARLEAAGTALALLHAAWARVAPAVGPCPAVRRRLDVCRVWDDLVAAGWRPDPAPGDPVRPWVERAWAVVSRHVADVPRRLALWRDRPLPLHACLCDVWHDHVLFEGDLVTGLVDFGGVKTDHPAVDLARLLGSMVGDDAALRGQGLRAYARVRPLSADEEGLVARLDETGTVLGLANWLRWLYRDGREYEDREAVARRVGELVVRVEGWSI